MLNNHEQEVEASFSGDVSVNFTGLNRVEISMKRKCNRKWETSSTLSSLQDHNITTTHRWHLPAPFYRLHPLLRHHRRRRIDPPFSSFGPVTSASFVKQRLLLAVTCKTKYVLSNDNAQCCCCCCTKQNTQTSQSRLIVLCDDAESENAAEFTCAKTQTMIFRVNDLYWTSWWKRSRRLWSIIL